MQVSILILIIGIGDDIMKPFVNINFCYKCGCPVPRIGLSIRTKAGNVSVSTPFICPKCKKKKKR